MNDLNQENLVQNMKNDNQEKIPWTENLEIQEYSYKILKIFLGLYGRSTEYLE